MNNVVKQMTSFIVMDVLDKANEMAASGIDDIIHLEVGEPDFDMPKCACESVAEALNSGFTHYTHSLGTGEFRHELSRFYKKEYGIDVEADRFVITSGSSPAILLAMMIMAGQGNEDIISNPGYACYRNFILSCGANPVEFPLSASEGFQFDVEKLKKTITPQTAAIVINSPMNPTGTLLEPSVMRDMANLGVPIISDEIYHGLVYGSAKAHTMLEFTDEAFVVGGFSKRYAMTGLRIGYLIAPKRFMRDLQTLQQNLFICAPSISQKAALSVLSGAADSEVQNMCKTYNERRVYLLERLKSIGFDIQTEPMGAFYVFADASRFTSDCYKFAFDVLEKCHVGITPGIDFGSRGERFVRFSYANSIENIRTAMDRLQSILC
ncbi:MAG: pyridoxal phosphate-dependent aminotransferase [Paludibacteraceae bacterium]|nr:pyridoxal phosphate-dependent aminotransferase [Paludibacteraceae bacterium]